MPTSFRNPSLRSSKGRVSKPQFYIAELVQECRVRGFKTSFVWVNIHLLKARSAAEAYTKALRKGKEHNHTYKAGEKGTPARWIFRGLRELMPIYEKMSDGAEIMFESYNRITPAGVRRMIRPRNRLHAFQDKA